ncbi:SDR family oxidoreductase [Lacibacter sediminis]|uniref:Aldehyde reductase n=1 Tax=Lacibacter sediminis TaxID=2760713 RepID=A0A7G5XKA8_9BACT|nr:aldehyde reductase [Lacibacter sediminis]QNA45911.1 aldehyde reductase [Lacibacter sediminis]
MKKSLAQELVLVTGGSGFVGTHIIAKLLQQGFTVRTTLRSINKKQQVIDALRRADITSVEKLSFFEAELERDDNWNEAVKNCSYVLHVASPFLLKEPKDENELIIPARDGVLRVLRASRNAGVKRVVLTSTFGAIGYSIDPKNHVFTEADWTDPSAPLAAYIKSKTIAEKAAWDFIAAEGGSLELTVINPVGIFGPALGNDYSVSIELIKNLIEGNMNKSYTEFSFGVVDVRDVAEIHIKAMKNPAAKGERFLLAADGAMTFYDVAELIKKERKERSLKIENLNSIDKADYIQLSNSKAKVLLDWQPISKEEAILASVDSLFA